mmetsp:Transcript_4742/g.10441  ORF Transcript_4742/g.10441 Transcript_4742/m.10441 type:complete len:698 (+) Transcript_4742:52-2145(+)
MFHGGTNDDFSGSTGDGYDCRVGSFRGSFKDDFHLDYIAETERVELTNPGIIERIRQDIQDYLSIHGFRLEKKGCSGKSTTSDGGNDVDERSPDVAILFIPRLPYVYDDSEHHVECQIKTLTRVGKNKVNTAPVIEGATNDSPLGTLFLHVQEESVLHTVGPLLRTYLRLSSHSINPRRLRAVVDCQFILRKQQKQLQRNMNRLVQSVESTEASRMAHHIHMIIRNSMGSALCVELVIILPFYRDEVDFHLIDEDIINGPECSSKSSTLVPTSKKAVQIAMENNPDACYPSVQLVERKDGIYNSNNTSVIDIGNTNGYWENVTETYSVSSTLHLNVSTRMCTVRHQPLLFHWVTSLSLHICLTPFGDKGVEDNHLARSDSSSSTMSEIIQDDEIENRVEPLIVACIEKVANLHRILMLCHDYYDEKKMELDACLMQNVIVVVPGNGKEDGVIDESDVECSETSNNISSVKKSDATKNENKSGNNPYSIQNRKKRGKREKPLSPRSQHKKLMLEFEEAIDNFHNVIFSPDNEIGNKDQNRQRNRDRLYRPTLTFESQAVEVVSSVIRRRRGAMTHITKSSVDLSTSSSATPSLQDLSLVGIDLHPKALTLHGRHYYQPNSTICQRQAKPAENQNQQQQTKCRALRMMRRSDAIVFGYESTGIPKALSEVLSGWVEIPSRSSINVVAAMSIVMDALFSG